MAAPGRFHPIPSRFTAHLGPGGSGGSGGRERDHISWLLGAHRPVTIWGGRGRSQKP